MSSTYPYRLGHATLKYQKHLDEGFRGGRSRGPDEDEDDGSVFAFWSKAVKLVWDGVFFLLTLPQFLPLIGTIILSMIWVGFVLVVVYLIIRAALVVHMRTPQLMHSADVETFTEQYISDLRGVMSKLSNRLENSFLRCMTIDEYVAASGNSDRGNAQRAVRQLATHAATLKSNIDTLLGRDFDTDIKTHLMHEPSLSSRNFFARHDIRHNAPQFVVDHDINDDMIDDFLKAVSVKFQKMGRAVNKLSDAIQEMPNVGTLALWNTFTFQTVAEVHTLRILMSYEQKLKTMYRTRSNNVAVAMWTVYYAPYVVGGVGRIKKTWARTPQLFIKYNKDGLQWWITQGIKLSMMPCHLAFSDPNQRAEKCRPRLDDDAFEQFDDDRGDDYDHYDDADAEDSDDAHDDAHDGDDVIEGVSIMSALKSIVRFVENIKFVGIAIKNFGKKFPKDPVGSIFGILMLIFGTSLGIVLMILYEAVTVLGVIFVLIGLSSTIMTFVYPILLVLYEIIVLVLFSIPFALIWLFIDLPTGGLATKMMRCEQLPDDWMNLPNYADDNRWLRIPPFCFAPCSKLYKPTMMCWCKKQDHYMPDFCPQQQIFRLYRNIALSEPYAFDLYRAPPGFNNLSLQTKQQQIVSAYKNKMSWYQKCYNSLDDYDFVNKFICENVSRVPDLSAANRERLKTLCKECYCDYEPGRASVGAAVAARMTAIDSTKRASRMCKELYMTANAESKASFNGPALQLLKRTLLLMILVVFVVIMFYVMMKGTRKMLSSKQLAGPRSLHARRSPMVIS